MIEALRRRRDFEALQSTAFRGRSGALRVRYRPGAPGAVHHRVAFAIGRAVGPAVVRNRRRRQLRALCRRLAVDHPDRFPPGDYLLALDPTDATYRELEQWLMQALLEARRARPAS